MARIWRASFPHGGREVEVVIVDAGAVEQWKTSQFPSIAQALLEMSNCSECERDWPFEDLMGLDPLLKQVEDGWNGTHATYLSWRYNGLELHAVGLGSTLHPRTHPCSGLQCSHLRSQNGL